MINNLNSNLGKTFLISIIFILIGFEDIRYNGRVKNRSHDKYQIGRHSNCADETSF